MFGNWDGQMEYKIMSFLIEYSTGAMKTLTPEIDGGKWNMHIFDYVYWLAFRPFGTFQFVVGRTRGWRNQPFAIFAGTHSPASGQSV
jgi:hypothetical protein